VTAAGCLVATAAASLFAVACSSGTSKAGGATTASLPTAAGPGSATSPVSHPGGSGACRAGGPASGATGGGDVAIVGDIPDNQAYVAYQSTTDGYRLSVPEGWGRTQTGSAVTFGQQFSSISVQVTARSSAPSVTTAQSSDVAALTASTSCFQFGKVSQVTRKAGPAVLVTYRADSVPDAVTGKSVREDVERYEFWRSGKEVIITLSSPQGSDNVDPWRKVTDSFAWAP
jgi:hypothetical protein